ncbi:PREDICTED: uncharacterized protein LOC109160043 [Ipomoea nil]|uniref:uncharacterized protein LOC109160043 n=1 Tax=Ipomoea nil TaxID=35883 RepID=UPI000901EAA9|nr:PREDICTED: uncharacterized protein LOC109160043 [Ipomoea nil]XP_019163697.1 PREDICTED: uncharacterized protein LOC109160043 [Ipomoea nil]
MSSSGLGNGFLSGYSGGFLGMNRPQQPQLNGNDVGNNRIQSSMDLKMELENGKRIELLESKGPAQKGFTMTFGKDKRVFCNNDMSDEDEPSLAEDGNGENEDEAPGKKGSQWQRMKWTDSIVKLLIQVVAYVGDDVCLEGPEGLKRKSGCIQKKGKWKTVSKIMISKGCHVSPQQCEDKFNDLNKRYKKLNDILGRGTSCAVVENPALMDSMPQLSAKAKDTVKKILCSKHLFYREMCAYHNGQKIPDCSDLELQIHSSSVATHCSKDNNGCPGDEAEENDDSVDDESGDEENNTASGDAVKTGTCYERRENEQSVDNDCFGVEIDEFFQDPTKSQWERKAWIKKRMLQLEEERVGIEEEAVELEKRRFKWQRFCSEKDRELEIERLENERLILENKRMVLQLKLKDHELDLPTPCVPFKSGPLSLDRP